MSVVSRASKQSGAGVARDKSVWYNANANTGIVMSKVGSVQCQLASTDESEMIGIKVDPS